MIASLRIASVEVMDDRKAILIFPVDQSQLEINWVLDTIRRARPAKYLAQEPYCLCDDVVNKLCVRVNFDHEIREITTAYNFHMDEVVVLVQPWMEHGLTLTFTTKSKTSRHSAGLFRPTGVAPTPGARDRRKKVSRRPARRKPRRAAGASGS